MCSIYTHRLIFSERERFKVIDLVSFFWSGSERNLVGYHKYIPSILKSYHKGNFYFCSDQFRYPFQVEGKLMQMPIDIDLRFIFQQKNPYWTVESYEILPIKNSVSSHLYVGAKSVKLSLIIGHESRKYWSN